MADKWLSVPRSHISFSLPSVWLGRRKHFSFFPAMPPDLSHPGTQVTKIQVQQARQKLRWLPVTGPGLPPPRSYPAALWPDQYLTPLTGHSLGKSFQKDIDSLRLSVIL